MRERIFFVTPFPLYPITNGGARYSDFILRKLLRDGLDLTVFLPEENAEPGIPASNGPRYVFYRSRNALDHFLNPDLTAKLKQECLAHPPRCLYLDHPFGYFIVRNARGASKIHVTTVLHNLEYQRYLSLGKPVAGGLIYAVEKTAIRRSDALWAISETVASAVETHFGRKPAVVPYTPDPKQFCPLPASDIIKLKQALYPGQPHVVLFFGDLTYAPNRDGAMFIRQKIIPAVFRKNRAVHFTLAGRGAEAWAGTDRLHTQGHVEHIEGYLQAADLIIAPVEKGGGVSTKVIESLSCGKNVLVTPFVAAGLDAGMCSRVRTFEREAFAGAILDYFRDRVTG